MRPLALALAAATATLSLGTAPVAAQPDERSAQVQADLGLTVVGLAYEHPVASRLAIAVEAGVLGTYFLPWFDLGDNVTAAFGGVRGTWFARPDATGLYVTPYVRAGYGRAEPDGAGLTGEATIVTAGAFVGWAVRLTPRLDLRAGLGAQYLHATGATTPGASTPFVAIDLVVGYRL